MEDADDARLIAMSLEGNSSAFGVLVERYQDRLIHSLRLALGSREEARDTAQTAFVSAWRKLRHFRQDAAFYSWLYRIAMNAAISARRKRRIRTQSLDAGIAAAGMHPPDESHGSQPHDRLEESEEHAAVREELAGITEDFRMPLVMKEIDGLSYDEIAEALEIPVGTVRSRIFRGRRELTDRLHRRFRAN